MAAFFAYCGIDAYVSFGDSKDYLPESIDWITDNTNQGDRLHTNNNAIAYSSGLIENYDVLMRHFNLSQIESAAEGDLFAVEFDNAMEQLFTDETVAPYLELRQSFLSESDLKIGIYQRTAFLP